MCLSDKESPCHCRRRRFHSWVRKIPWGRKWQPTPELLPGKPHGQRNLVGHRLWVAKSRTGPSVCAYERSSKETHSFSISPAGMSFPLSPVGNFAATEQQLIGLVSGSETMLCYLLLSLSPLKADSSLSKCKQKHSCGRCYAFSESLLSFAFPISATFLALITWLGTLLK